MDESEGDKGDQEKTTAPSSGHNFPAVATAMDCRDILDFILADLPSGQQLPVNRMEAEEDSSTRSTDGSMASRWGPFTSSPLWISLFTEMATVLSSTESSGGVPETENWTINPQN